MTRSPTSGFNLTPLLDVLLILIFALTLKQSLEHHKESQALADARGRTEAAQAALEQERRELTARNAKLTQQNTSLRQENRALHTLAGQARLFDKLDDKERAAFSEALEKRLTLVYLYLSDNTLIGYRTHLQEKMLPFDQPVLAMVDRRYQRGFFPTVDDTLPGYLSQRNNPNAIYLLIDQGRNTCELLDNISREYKTDMHQTKRLLILPAACDG